MLLKLNLLFSMKLKYNTILVRYEDNDELGLLL